MFQTTLITNGTQELRKIRVAAMIESINTKPAYCYAIFPSEDTSTIKIQDIRALRPHLILKPPPAIHMVLTLHELQHATNETQQALLKLLEEPPFYLNIFITADAANKLLPTIQSRCLHILLSRSKQRVSAHDTTEIQKLVSSGIGERFAHAAIIAADKTTAIIWLKNALTVLHERLHAGNVPTCSDMIRLTKIARALQTLERTNTNPRLLMENLLLEM